jgi:hypothetical protein
MYCAPKKIKSYHAHLKYGGNLLPHHNIKSLQYCTDPALKREGGRVGGIAIEFEKKQEVMAGENPCENDCERMIGRRT